jgi:hypothetical protein
MYAGIFFSTQSLHDICIIRGSSGKKLKFITIKLFLHEPSSAALTDFYRNCVPLEPIHKKYGFARK